MKYNKEEISRLAIDALSNNSLRSYDKVGVFAYGISEEIAKKLMSQRNISDTFVLEEMRSIALEHFSLNFRGKFDPEGSGCAASYIIGMLRNAMIDYLRSLSRADKYGELNKSFAVVPDEHGNVKRRLVQSVKDDYISEQITDVPSRDLSLNGLDVNDLDFDNSYIYKKEKK